MINSAFPGDTHGESIYSVVISIGALNTVRTEEAMKSVLKLGGVEVMSGQPISCKTQPFAFDRCNRQCFALLIVNALLTIVSRHIHSTSTRLRPTKPELSKRSILCGNGIARGAADAPPVVRTCNGRFYHPIENQKHNDSTIVASV